MLPSLSMIPNDPEESARVQYASTIAALATRAKHFLTQAQMKSSAAAVPGLAPAPAEVQARRLLADVQLQAALVLCHCIIQHRQFAEAPPRSCLIG